MFGSKLEPGFHFDIFIRILHELSWEFQGKKLWLLDNLDFKLNWDVTIKNFSSHKRLNSEGDACDWNCAVFLFFVKIKVNFHFELLVVHK